MDPISHGLIGAGVAAFSGQPLSLDNPIYLGSILGSMAPDLDIVMQTRGHIAYLKHHRGVSHSIPGLLAFSAVISLALYAIFPGAAFGSIFAWTFAGALSHSIFDLLNSYGARLLWPFVKRRLTINFIILTDPVILALFVTASFYRTVAASLTAFCLSGLYLLLRWESKRRAASQVSKAFGLPPNRVLIFPAMYKPFQWNFIADQEEYFITGSAQFRRKKLNITEVFDKLAHPSIEVAEESPLGDVFRDFTPHYHVSHSWEENTQVVKFMDLRYFSKEGFIHTGTALLDAEGELLEAVFEPYGARKRIRLA